jgi:asparagine synthase (glutamine-hydrolysing)
VSGLVGILNLDGAPVDPLLLRQMTQALVFRGPDAQQTWIDGSVGLGHTLLATTDEAVREDQPCSLDGQVWLVADARVDGRSDLRAKLATKGRTGLEKATDAELILQAYHAWGDACTEHLIGDFAFAIWDGRRRRLFCARDHFGVKPFYYARTANGLVFSNTLACLRLHPAVSDELNDLAIADFLLFGGNQELDTTSFADIRSLPPAHVLTCSDGPASAKRYWTLPENDEIRYRRGRDYVDNFQELMDQAVADRLRTDRVATFLSGGLDSATIAATAVGLRSRRPGLDLRAYTAVYDWFIPDQERYYTGQTAAALGIPVEYLAADELAQVPWVDESEVPTPEPDANLCAPNYIHLLRRIAANGRVVLDGNGGDETLRPSGSYVLAMFSNLRLGRLALDVGRTVCCQGRLPRLGFRAALKHWFGPSRPQPRYPDWLNPEFAARLDLPGRWKAWALDSTPLLKPRGVGRSTLTSCLMPNLFQCYDPGLTYCPVEVRYPFLDVRLVSYLLALPVLPWCLDKELLRVALRGKVPEVVRRRPKTPLSRDPLSELARRGGLEGLTRPEPAPQLTRYVNPSALDLSADEAAPDELWINCRPRKLNIWLQSLVSVHHHPFCPTEQSDEDGNTLLAHQAGEEAVS